MTEPILDKNSKLADLVVELDEAKQATMACLKQAGVLVDMHGLAYWASEVERLRQEIQDNL